MSIYAETLSVTIAKKVAHAREEGIHLALTGLGWLSPEDAKALQKRVAELEGKLFDIGQLAHVDGPTFIPSDSVRRIVEQTDD